MEISAETEDAMTQVDYLFHQISHENLEGKVFLKN